MQRAPIEPGSLKHLLLNLAIHTDDKGIAYPSVDLLAWETSMSISHAKRMLRIAKTAGLITVVSAGGGAVSARYRINLDVVARGFVAAPTRRIPDVVVDALRHSEAGAGGFTVEPGSTMNPVHGGDGRGFHHEPGGGSTMSYEPHLTPRTPVLGGGGSVPPGPAAAPPALGSAPGLPGELRRELFDALVGNGPRTPPRVGALTRRAHELVQAGHDINALAQHALEMGWARFALPPKPQAPGPTKNATKARKPGRAAAATTIPIPKRRATREEYMDDGRSV